MNPDQKFVLGGELAPEVLEKMLVTLREKGEIYIKAEQPDKIEALAVIVARFLSIPE